MSRALHVALLVVAVLVIAAVAVRHVCRGDSSDPHANQSRVCRAYRLGAWEAAASQPGAQAAQLAASNADAQAQLSQMQATMSAGRPPTPHFT